MTNSHDQLKACAECGMMCAVNEYHPYAACLMFKACRNSKKVRDNLQSVIDHANTRPTAVASHAEGEVVAWQWRLAGSDGLWTEAHSSVIDAMRSLPSHYETRPLYLHPPRSGDEAMDAARWQAFKRYVYETVGGNHLLDRLAVLDIGAWDGCIDQLAATMAARGDDK